MIEIVVFDDAVGPESLHQLVFADEAAMLLDENAERVEDFGVKWNQFTRTQQAAFRDIQLKRFEAKEHKPRPLEDG